MKCSCERGEKTPYNCWSCDQGQDYSRPLTEAEQKLADSAWPDYHGGKPHPFSTSTGMEGGCHHCGYTSESILHNRPWEPPIPPRGAPLSTDLPPHITDTSWKARMDRLMDIAFKAPAVSTPSGGEQEKDNFNRPENETPLANPWARQEAPKMQVYLNLTIDSLNDLVTLVQTITDAEGIKFESVHEGYASPSVTTATESDDVQMRRVAHTSLGISALVREACDRDVPLVIDYEDAGGSRTYNRCLHDVYITSDGLLRGQDDSREGSLRTFTIDNITRAELG